MELELGPPRRLHSRGPATRGVTVDREGLALGPDCVLVRRRGTRYQAAAPGDIRTLLNGAFDYRGDEAPLHRKCAAIAKALGDGDLLKAQLLGLLLPIGELDAFDLRRLRLVSKLIKFDSTQPRDADGRWSNFLGQATARMAAFMASPAAEGFVAALGRLAPRLTNPVALAGGLLVLPTNESHLDRGSIPGHDDIRYNYDEGNLRIAQTDEAGNEHVLFFGGPDEDRLYRDKDGTVVGHALDNGVVLDPDAPLFRKPQAATSEDEPRLCPDPGPDWPSGMSEQAAAYQRQITGLPSGMAVTLNNVTFDGCRESDGVMLEAKAIGYVWAMRADGTYAPYYQGAEGLMKQACAQNRAAEQSGRRVEWYFAERAAADYFRNAFRIAGFTNITVFYQPPVK
jgi:hypothetical protein